VFALTFPPLVVRPTAITEDYDLVFPSRYGDEGTQVVDLTDVWGIGCEEIPADLPDGRRRHGITMRRILNGAEVEAARSANDLLAEEINGPYGRLMDKFADLFEGIDATLRLTTPADRLAGDSLPERFNTVLHAFKTFLDHTPSSLRRRYGRGSAVEGVFVAACTEEYDTAFAYRLSYNLRNEAEHKRDVIDVSYGGRLTADGSVRRNVRMTIANAILDDPVLDRWQPRVRLELRAHARPVSADELMRVLQISTARIFAKTLLAQRAGIETAIAAVRLLSAEADCKGRPVLIRYGPPDPSVPDATTTMHISPLQTEAADVVETALADSGRLLQS
jgi:hypothetical protein